jgi:hypothetical protein
MHLLAPIVQIKPMKFPRKLKQFCMEPRGGGEETSSPPVHHTDLRGNADVDVDDGVNGERKWRRPIPCNGDVYWRPAARKDGGERVTARCGRSRGPAGIGEGGGVLAAGPVLRAGGRGGRPRPPNLKGPHPRYTVYCVVKASAAKNLCHY